jgi:glucosamine kinase
VTPAVLAVDAGQTKVRAALSADGSRERTAVAPGVPRAGTGVGPEEVAAPLLKAVAELGPLPDPVPPVAIGLSGYEAIGEEGLAALGEKLLAGLAVERLAIATDGLTALFGAIGSRDGVVVAAGTGTACLARRGERFAKVDGWGSLLGDAGSGFAIGRAGLDAALRAHDGRGGSASLIGPAERRYGPMEQLAARVYADPVPTRAVAAFATDLAALAGAGDPAARAILGEAGRELAISACGAAARLFEPGERALVSYSGNVFEAGEPIVGPFVRAVEELRPGTEVVEPSGDPLDGALLLGGLAPELRPVRGILRTWA